jgi:hypothetical protein
MATGYWLEGRIRFRAVQDFSVLRNVQTGSGANRYPELKRQGHEADHLPPSGAELKNGGAIPPLTHMSSWHTA